MDQKKKKSDLNKPKNSWTNIFNYIVIFGLLISIALYFTYNYSISKLPISNQALNESTAKILPENPSHYYAEQIIDIQKKLDICVLERDSLKQNVTQAALKLSDSFRLLINEIFKLNAKFYSQNDYTTQLSKVRQILKLPNIDILLLEKNFKILDEYNVKYIKLKSEPKRIDIATGWLKNFLERYIIIQKLSEDSNEKDYHHAQARLALTELENYLSSDKFLKIYMGK